MTKSKKDLFGIEDNSDNDENNEDLDYAIMQISPADGWLAIFEPDKAIAPTPRVLGLACFALVEIDDPDDAEALSERAVRPMVVDEMGDINDVAALDGFVCVVPPGRDPTPYIEHAMLVKNREK